jgi:hypothetical protein
MLALQRQRSRLLPTESKGLIGIASGGNLVQRAQQAKFTLRSVAGPVGGASLRVASVQGSEQKIDETDQKLQAVCRELADLVAASQRDGKTTDLKTQERADELAKARDQLVLDLLAQSEAASARLKSLEDRVSKQHDLLIKAHAVFRELISNPGESSISLLVRLRFTRSGCRLPIEASDQRVGVA